VSSSDSPDPAEPKIKQIPAQPRNVGVYIGGATAVLLGVFLILVAWAIACLLTSPRELSFENVLWSGMTSPALLMAALGLYLIIGGVTILRSQPQAARRVWNWVWPAILLGVVGYFLA
jgi:predicted phage tail protein